MWALIVAMGLCGGCLDELVENAVDRTVSKHVEGVAEDLDGIADDVKANVKANVKADVKAQGPVGGMKIPKPRGEPTGKIAASSQTDACRADLAAGLEKIKEEQGLGIKVGDEHVDALVTEGKVTIQYARDGVKYRPGFGLQKIEAGCELRFYRRETIKPGHMQSATANYGSAQLTKCVCE